MKISSSLFLVSHIIWNGKILWLFFDLFLLTHKDFQISFLYRFELKTNWKIVDPNFLFWVYITKRIKIWRYWKIQTYPTQVSKEKFKNLYKGIEGEEQKLRASQAIQVVQVILLKIRELQWL